MDARPLHLLNAQRRSHVLSNFSLNHHIASRRKKTGIGIHVLCELLSSKIEIGNVHEHTLKSPT